MHLAKRNYKMEYIKDISTILNENSVSGDILNRLNYNDLINIDLLAAAERIAMVTKAIDKILLAAKGKGLTKKGCEQLLQLNNLIKENKR